MNEKIYKETLERLKKLCSKSEKCEFDILQKMEEWNVEEEIRGKIVKELKNGNYLNHERYARSFAHDKIKFNKWGKIKVKYYLKQKRIDETIINEALSLFPVEEYRELCKNEIQKKYKSLHTNNKIVAKKRLVSFAQQRGFENQLIFEIVSEVFK